MYDSAKASTNIEEISLAKLDPFLIVSKISLTVFASTSTFVPVLSTTTASSWFFNLTLAESQPVNKTESATTASKDL